tara:strand:- start:920 stop:1174 length:255 start_codon:yes stop_codon:yes gene_type:complete
MGISYAQEPKEVEQLVDENAVYMVDWTKMTSVNDMVLILASMAIGFPGNHPNIQQLKPFLNLENPIKQQPQVKEVSLPKLKKIK